MNDAIWVVTDEDGRELHFALEEEALGWINAVHGTDDTPPNPAIFVMA